MPHGRADAAHATLAELCAADGARILAHGLHHDVRGLERHGDLTLSAIKGALIKTND
jgi:hypothetical protein